MRTSASISRCSIWRRPSKPLDPGGARCETSGRGSGAWVSSRGRAGRGVAGAGAAAAASGTPGGFVSDGG